MLLIFLGYSVGSFFGKQMLGVFKNHKYGILTGFAIQSLQILGMLLTYACYRQNNMEGVCDHTVLKYLNLFKGVVLGAFTSVYVWTGGYAFVDFVSLPSEKPVHFSIYFLFMEFKSIAGNALNILLFSLQMDVQACLLVFLALFVLATLAIPVLLPATRGYSPELDDQ